MTFLHLLSLSLLTGTLSAACQTYTAKSIQFSQLGSFTQKQLEEAAGLPIGRSFTTTELGTAAQRLVDTGYFDNVEATLNGRIGAVTVIFKVKPTDRDRMLHVGFENLIWLTHDEIDAAIKTKLPLFMDYLPESSSHLDELTAALVAALAAKSITAQIGYETFEPTLRHPLREISFRVVSPTIRVININLSGVTHALVPLVQKSVNGTAKTLYTEGPSDETTADRVLAPLLDAGYIQASLTDAVPTFSPVSKGEVGVTLSATLNAGDIFHLSEISFAGTPVLSAQSFANTASLHSGDIASRAALLKTLAPLDAVYRQKGYMDVVVTAAPTLNRNTHTVTYAVNVQPGEPYRIHEVAANNLLPAAQADFNRNFLMKTGEIYNPDYVSGFFRNNTALRTLQDYSATFKASADPNTHTVDLIITFVHL